MSTLPLASILGAVMAGDGDIGDVASGMLTGMSTLKERGRSLDGDVVGRPRNSAGPARQSKPLFMLPVDAPVPMVSGVCHAGVVATGVVGAGVCEVARVGDAGVEGADVAMTIVVARVGDAGDKARVKQPVLWCRCFRYRIAGAGADKRCRCPVPMPTLPVPGKQADVETARVGAADAPPGCRG